MNVQPSSMQGKTVCLNLLPCGCSLGANFDFLPTDIPLVTFGGTKDIYGNKGLKGGAYANVLFVLPFNVTLTLCNLGVDELAPSLLSKWT